ncbi:unnamed protein product [Microthlaspi erraticum]|uniref:RING-type domain-containing protein n=1 Tax=Microthlaspi erraticum TaxID=1685480 RepID=A0A6D2IDI2_9BRAS|nr:unnamed protein product [Microthlaspi erraticum]
MELTTVQCNLTVSPYAFPPPLTDISVSIDLRMFRHTVCLAPLARECNIIKEHKLVCPPIEIKGQFTIATETVTDGQIDAMLKLSLPKMVKSWLRKRVAALITSKAAAHMTGGHHHGYSIKGDVDVIFERCVPDSYDLAGLPSLKVEDIKRDSCPICLGDISGGQSCMAFHCSHLFHKDCVWGWLRNNITCPNCRRCLCGKGTCKCIKPTVSSHDDDDDD